MSTYFEHDLQECIGDFFERDVACAVVHMNNGQSFTYFNNTYFKLPKRKKNVNEIMKAVVDINEKLMDEEH